MELELNEKIFKLNDEGFTAGKIAQKLRVKKAIVQDILGNAANKGLGDAVEAITKATGIKAVVDALVDDCGCAARKESLNKLFPNRKLNDLPNEDYDYLSKWFKADKKSVKPKEQLELVAIYNRVFNSKRKITNCGPCLAGVVRELKEIFVNV